MAVRFSPIFNHQVVDSSGNPASGWKINTYLAGTSTPATTYTTSAGSVAQSNPIIINSLGFPTTGQIWLTDGVAYKLVLTNAGDVVQKTEDNISGVNDSSETSGEWSASSSTPTYISATSFSVTGDQTTDLHIGRRLKFTVNAGTVYGRIRNSAFSSVTTVTMVMESTALDSGLSAFSLSVLRNDNLSIPDKVHLDQDYTDLASAATANIFSQVTRKVNITGTTTITALDATPFAQAGKIVTGKFAGILTLTNNATSLIIPGGANITTAAGDTFVAEALGSGNVRIVNYVKADGTAIVATSVPAAASQAEMETATSTTVYATPGRTQYHPGVAKAWFSITNSGGAVTVNTSHNITSITRDSTGIFTVTIATDFSSAEYVCAGIYNNADSANNNKTVTFQAQAAGSVKINFGDGAGAATDPAYKATIVFFGDQ